MKPSRGAAAALALLLALAGAARAQATTYHVRVDGGSAAQCSGRVDRAASARGTSKDCAWRSPFDALPADGAARIRGGDTLVIGPGDYMIGRGAPGIPADSNRCAADWPWDCTLAAVPGGPSPQQPTRILGQGSDAGCRTPPILWGTQRVAKVLDLEGSSNVEIGCLEITDRSDCIESHVDPAVRCQRDAAPYGQWAAVGISARASRNVWLHDLHIHGLANRGILAGGLRDWTLDRVRIIANGWAGWDGDIGAGSGNAGRILMRHVTIAWNGCGQRWRTGAIHGCWAQESGGYGDGLGTGPTGGQWVIEDSEVSHNTSDGIDLLYLDNAPGTSMVVRRVLAVGNAGNQVKASGSALIENSVIVGTCAFFSGRDRMTDGDACRAQGNAVSLALGKGRSATVRHNTITGEGDCLLLSTSGDRAARLLVQNNALIGQRDWRANRQGNAGELTCGHYADDSPARVAFSGNAFWQLKSDPCPPGGNLCGEDPELADTALGSFDPTPRAGSPLIDRAPPLPAVRGDRNGRPRPAGAAADIGAVEWQPKQ